MTSELRDSILALQIPKENRLRHNYEGLNRRKQRRALACGKKRQYTFDYAQEVVKRFRRNHNRVMKAYRCRHCQSWHVGQPREFERDERGMS